MYTIEQEFAKKIYDEQIEPLKEQLDQAKKAKDQSPEARKRFEDIQQKINQYGGMAHKLPVLIRQAGLVQALAYVSARGKSGAKQLLEDLARVLGYDSSSQLLDASREAELLEYMHLTRKATVALTWYKRFAQSVLGVEPTDEGGD